MALWQPHHSLPAIGSILVTGVAAVPTDTVNGSVVFQPPPATQTFMLSVCTPIRFLNGYTEQKPEEGPKKNTLKWISQITKKGIHVFTSWEFKWWPILQTKPFIFVVYFYE